MRSPNLFSIALFLTLVTLPGTAMPSSDAGIDLSAGNINIRIVYSVALDYAGGESCVRKPECLLYDIISLLQNSDIKSNQEEVIQFDLYQSDSKEGNWLAMVRNPFVGPQPYADLYDGMAQTDLSAQIITLLQRELAVAPDSKRSNTVKLYRCTDSRKCNDIRFGSFPSTGEHTGYCLSQSSGCAREPIIVPRHKMKRYFTELPE